MAPSISKVPSVRMDSLTRGPRRFRRSLWRFGARLPDLAGHYDRTTEQFNVKFAIPSG